jgi:hypothetical protein
MRLLGRSISQRVSGLLLVLALVLSLTSSYGNAQDLSATSLQGTYGGFFLGDGGRLPVAGVAVITLDGNGQITAGRALFDLPDAMAFGKRTRLEVPSISGTYEVDEAGKGKVAMPALFPEWIENWDITVVKAQIQSDGTGLAQELFWMGETVETLEGNLVTSTFKRLPDGAVFDNASLAGVYVRRIVPFGRQIPIAGLSAFLFANGDGSGSGNTILNVPGGHFDERFVLPIPGEATTVLSADGLAIITPSEFNRNLGLGEAISVVLRAEPRDDGSYLATEVFAILDLLSTGNVLAVYAPRRSD